MTVVLEARNVGKSFGGGMLHRRVSVALEGVTLTLDEQQPTVLAVAGESGSGKTTLARLLLGLIEPSSGAIHFRGTPLGKLSGRQRLTYRREVQAIFQDPFEVFNPYYTVDHALSTPLRKFGLARSAPEQRTLMADALERVGLRAGEILGRYPHQVSGGQRQRIMVARALLLRPKVIVADEPVSMVDASLRATILESLLQLNRELGISLVYITHDLTTAYQVSDSIIVLYRGAVAEAGGVEQVIRRPRHPYTQLLVDSIPQPDPTIRWGSQELPTTTADVGGVGVGCRFSDRCPHVMPICHEAEPLLFRAAPGQVATCYLEREHPTLSPDELPLVLGQAQRAGPAADLQRG